MEIIYRWEMKCMRELFEVVLATGISNISKLFSRIKSGDGDLVYMYVWCVRDTEKNGRSVSSL